MTRFVSGGTQLKLTQRKMNSIPFPLPPLDEQRRVVQVLDSFETLVSDLSSGLPAEIEARRQQYAYYRDRILSFEEAV